MRPKSRLLKILLIGLGVFLVVGYFAFSNLFFSPLEKPFAARLAALVSRDVDLYVAKSELRALFDEFPRPAIMDDLEDHPAWKVFSRSPEYADLVGDLGVENAVAELEKTLAQVPVLDIEPLKLFGGKEVALAARISEGVGTPIDWMLLGRCNWMGKLGASALSYPGVLGLDAQGIAVEKGDGWVQLSGGQLTQPLFIGRMQDVLMVASVGDFITTARELSLRGGELSILQSARYYDHIHNAPMRKTEEEFEFFVDVRKLTANQGMQGAWPDVRSDFFGPALAGRLFQLPACGETVGLMDFRGGVAVDLHTELASESITPAQTRVYRHRGFGHTEIFRDAAAIVPEDAGLFVYLKGPIGTLLNMALESVEPALRTNVEDAFRSTGRYNGLGQLVDEIDASIHDRLLLILRERDYEYGKDEEVPPNDGEPTFAVALVTWSEDAARIKQLSDAIGNNGEIFGLEGAEPGQGGYYSHNFGGFQAYEFWSPFVSGTGVVTTMRSNEHFIVSNEIKMLPHLLRTVTRSDEVYRRLSDLPMFQALVGSSMSDANALVWVNPKRLGPTLRKLARSWAENNAQLGVNWSARRQEEERKQLPALFPGKRRDQLNQTEQAQLDGTVDDVLRNEEARLKNEAVPQLMARKVREIEYLEAIEAGLLMMKLDPRSIDLSMRVIAPLDEG